MNFWKVHVNLAPHPHTDPAQSKKYVGKQSLHPAPAEPIGEAAPRPPPADPASCHTICEQVNNLTKVKRDGPAGYEEVAHWNLC